MKNRSVAVIGAGAAGMTAAIAAARHGASVTVYEHRREAGRKLLMTGNGKCNLTNRRMGGQYYYSDCPEGNALIRSVLAKFDEKETIAFFYDMGLLTYDRDGYVYPQSEQAVTVRDVLVRECLFEGVAFYYDTDVYPLLRYDERLNLFFIGEVSYDRLILACGGKSERQTGSDGSGYEIAKRFGHRICTPLPGLVPLYTNEPGWQSMAGVRAKARFCLFIEGQPAGESCGELQFTAQGISGIPVFELSRIAVHGIHEGKQVEAEICLLYGREQEKIRALISHMLVRSQTGEGASAIGVLNRMTGIVNEKILLFFLQKAGVEEHFIHNVAHGDTMECGMSEADADRLAKEVTRLLFSYRISIDGHGKLEHAQVTSGGLALHEVDAHLESRLRKGLFFAGEILDVDGICGGYNLQWAWSSGFAAGEAAARGGME